jgi:hypothetical protein
MSASVTRPPGATGWAGVGAGATGVAAGGSAEGLSGSVVDGEAVVAEDGLVAGWLAGRADVAAGGAALVVWVC